MIKFKFCASHSREELSLNKDAFNLFLTEGDASSKKITPADANDNRVEKEDHEGQEIGFIGPWKRPGRTPQYIKFPPLIDCATKIHKRTLIFCACKKAENNQDRGRSHVEGYPRTPFGECICVKGKWWHFL